MSDLHVFYAALSSKSFARLMFISFNTRFLFALNIANRVAASSQKTVCFYFLLNASAMVVALHNFV